MIIKIKSRKTQSYKQLLGYMMHDKDRLFDEQEQSFVITHNLKGNNIETWVKQFKENELLRQRKRSDSVSLTHEIISFHSKDSGNINLEMLEDMGREYVRLRNPKGIYVAVPHFDRDHYHIHILASGIEYKTGKSMRLPKIELSQLKQKIQQYQIEKYGLTNSIVKHGSSKQNGTSDDEYQFKLRTGQSSDRDNVLGLLKTCYRQAKSKEDFFIRLRELGIETYIRGGKLTGILYKNKKHRLGRLGFTPERIDELDKSLNREKQLSEMRNKRNKNIDRTI